MVFSSLNFIFIFAIISVCLLCHTCCFQKQYALCREHPVLCSRVIKQPYALFLLMVLTYLNYVFGICLYQIHNPRKRDSFDKSYFFDFYGCFCLNIPDIYLCRSESVFIRSS